MHTLSNYTFATVLKGKYYFHVHFIDENTESRRARSDLKRSHTNEGSEAGLYNADTMVPGSQSRQPHYLNNIKILTTSKTNIFI